MERKTEKTTTYTSGAPATAAGETHTELKPEYSATGTTGGPGMMESLKEKGQGAMERMKEMTGMHGQGTTTTTTGTTHAGMTTGAHQQPGMMESAKQGMEHMMERGKDMLGMSHQSTGQKLEQQWEGAKGGMQQQKESMSGAVKGASEGAQAGYQAGEKPYVQKGATATMKEGMEKAKHAAGMDKSSTGTH